MKKIITIMLAMVMLFATTVFIVGCGNGETVVETPSPTPTAEPTPTPTPIDNDVVEPEEEGGLQLAPPPPTPQPTPTPEPEIVLVPIDSMLIMIDGRPPPGRDFILRVDVGENEYVAVRVEPPEAEDSHIFQWESTDTEIFTVESLALREGGQNVGAIITGINAGEGYLIVTADGVSTEIPIRVFP